MTLRPARRSWLPDLQPQVVAFAGPLADAGEHRDSRRAPWRCGRSAPVRITVLPTPAPPKRPVLPPRTNGVSRSITSMPVSKSSVRVESSVTGGGSRWIGHALLGLDRTAVVDRIAEEVEHAAERGRADRHGERRPGVGDVFTAESGRRSSSRATHRTLPPPRCCCTSPTRCRAMPFPSRVDVDGVEDRRDCVLGKLDVERQSR